MIDGLVPLVGLVVIVVLAIWALRGAPAPPEPETTTASEDEPAPVPPDGVYAWVPLLKPPLLVAATPLPVPPACPLAALLAPEAVVLDLFEAATPPPVPEF